MSTNTERGERPPGDKPELLVVNKAIKRRWQKYLWDSLDKPSQERKFLFKLDAALMTFAFLGYFIKLLDTTNINNAFVSGMKENLSLYGNELNYMQTCSTVGFVIGKIPSNIVLTRIGPSIWIPSIEVTWAVLTFCLCRCTNARQIYVLRFFAGHAESIFHPGIQYVIGSWYRSDELAKRSSIVLVSAAIAIMCSGYLMTAVNHLGGVGGYAGWQWLFIVDGIISLPIALAGYAFIPDLPETSRAFYLSQEDKALAKKRMDLEGRK